MPRFFVAGPLAANLELSLPDTVVRHINVLRLREGDSITLFNGEGGEYQAVLRQLASEGTTMLIATQDLRVAAQIAQQVIFLEAGEVVEAGSARQMFPTPKRARTFEYISTLTERLPESWSI